MKNDELINQLSQDKPKKALPSIFSRYLKAIVFLSLYLTLVISFIGLRRNINDVMMTASFWFEVSSLVALFLTSSLAIFYFSTPGQENRFKKLYVISVFVIWPLIILIEYFYFGADNSYFSKTLAGKGLSCVNEIFFVGIFPTLFLLFLAKRGVPMLPRWTNFLIWLSGSIIGALSVQLTCSTSDPVHLILTHILPVILISGIAFKLGHKLLKW